MSVLTVWVHERIFHFMSKDRSPPAKTPEPTTAAAASTDVVPSTKDSINLRIDARSRQLIDEAAALLGKTRTEFMIESARREAVDVLLDQRLFRLDAEHYDAFAGALESASSPEPKLRTLLRRVPVWKK